MYQRQWAGRPQQVSSYARVDRRLCRVRDGSSLAEVSDFEEPKPNPQKRNVLCEAFLFLLLPCMVASGCIRSTARKQSVDVGHS